MPASKREYVTQREFARRKEVDEARVRLGLKTGRIKRETAGIDWATQSKSWDANLVKPQRRPKRVRTPRGAAQKSREAPGKKAETKKKTGERTLVDIQRDRELVKLEMERMNLRRSMGELVSASEQVSQGRAIAAAVISALYTIPDRIADELSGMNDAHAITGVLLREIDQAVEGLRKRAGAD